MGKFKEKWNSFRQKMKNMPKSKQSKAFVRVLQFFAIMLVLTIFAKGAAGVTMPRVTATRTYNAEISETIQASGTVRSKGIVDVEVPKGLEISKVNVSLGSRVKEGDVLLEFDTDALARQIKLENATLSEKQVELKELQNVEGVSTTALEAARKAVTKAETGYTTALNAESIAKGELEAAKAAHAAGPAAPPVKPAEPGAKPAEPGIQPEEPTLAEDDPDYAAAWADYTTKLNEYNTAVAAMEQYNAAVAAMEEYEKALAAYKDADRLKKEMDEADDAYQQAVSMREGAEESLTNARENLEQAQKEYDKAVEKQGIANERNKVAIELKQIEIADQQKVVAALREAQSAGGVLLATVEGTVSKVDATEGDTTGEATAIQITTNLEGFEVLIYVSQEQGMKLEVGSSMQVSSYNSWGSSEAIITSKYLDSETKQVVLRANLPGNSWSVGDTLDASVTLSKRQYYNCVPVSAVHTGTNGSFVYVLEERKTVLGNQLVVVAYDVTVEAKNTENVAIQMNIWDAQIVTGSSKPLNEGDRVRLEDTVNGV